MKNNERNEVRNIMNDRIEHDERKKIVRIMKWKMMKIWKMKNNEIKNYEKKYIEWERKNERNEVNSIKNEVKNDERKEVIKKLRKTK